MTPEQLKARVRRLPTRPAATPRPPGDERARKGQTAAPAEMTVRAEEAIRARRSQPGDSSVSSGLETTGQAPESEQPEIHVSLEELFLP